MAQQTLNSPADPRRAPSTSDSPEYGDTWKVLVDKCQAMFIELYDGLRQQAAPAAKTTSTTLTAAEIIAGLLTANQGGSAAATYTMPLGTSIETALLGLYPNLANDDAFDFTIVNISTVAAETVTLATNTGITLVGDMTIAAIALGDSSSGTFRVRRTAANTYSVYRLT